MSLRKAFLFYSRTSPVSNTCSSEYTSGRSSWGARAPTPPPPLVLRPRAENFFSSPPPLRFSKGLDDPPPPNSPTPSSLSQCLDPALYTVIIILFCPTEVFDLVYCLATFTFNCVDICSGLKYLVWNLGIFISIYKALSVFPSPF